VGKRRGAVPAIDDARESMEDGVMGCGPTLLLQIFWRPFYVGRILKGEKLSDRPVMLSAKFEFVINLKTAGQTARVRSSDASNGRGQRRGNSKSLPAM